MRRVAIIADTYECILYVSDNSSESTKIAGFDLDHTLTTAKSDKTFLEKICTKKIDAISNALEMEITWILSYEDDLYRKPRTKLFSLIDWSKDSFYCGDACGRPRDFSDTDLKFAKNLNIQFYSDVHMFTGIADSDTFAPLVKPMFETNYDYMNIRGTERDLPCAFV